MKDSGVEWIGEIPEHWNILKMKYKFEIKKVIKPTENPNVLSMTQRGIKIKDLNDLGGQHALNYDKYQEVNVGDFVMNSMDLLTGFVDYSNIEGVTSPDYRVFRFITNTDSHDYYLRYFQVCYWNKIFYGHGQGVSNLGRWRLQADVFKEFPIPEPPYEEQIEIGHYIDEKVELINDLIEEIKNNIIHLKEYRKSLIYEVVTGKIDVRDYQKLTS
ncbi:restriction endonuclease subunit S [Bacillus sp. CRN 9]|nr:restriction endonuclease subunit S [Bacillus sp. CRN 9]